MLDMTDKVIEVQESSIDNNDKKWCVYCHTNKINGKKYFGITSKIPEERWKNGRGYDKTQVYFYNAIHKYTWDGFVHEIISQGLTEAEAKKQEVDLIALYKTNCRRYSNPTYGYNCTDGGDGTSGHLVDDKLKKKISEAVINSYITTGRKPWNYGVSMTDEQKKKIKQANTGREISEDTRQKLSDAKKGKPPNNAGRPMSKETKKKLSNALKGHYVSDELKEQLSLLKKGKYLGVDSSRFRPVYCIELNEIFWGARSVNIKYGFNAANIGACCRGDRNYASRHPSTNEQLHWMYAENAIAKGYITQQNLDNYLKELKEMEIDINGTMEEKRSVC